MNSTAFEASLKADGYSEIETVTYEPRPANGEHGHHFSVRGLVLAGQFIVAQSNQPVSYGPGDSFNVAEGVLHTEEIGPQGARVLIGRKF